MDNLVEVKSVTKKFKEFKALDEVSLSFERGKIHGIIGRNGSGKTVLFKCICGFLKLDGGEILVDGKRIGKDIEAPESVGVIIENPGFLPGYSGYQNLSFLACIRIRSKSPRSKRSLSGWALTRRAGSMWASIPWACASGWESPRPLWRIRSF